MIARTTVAKVRVALSIAYVSITPCDLTGTVARVGPIDLTWW